MRIVYTILVAVTGGVVGVKLKIPAGALIGAMLAVAIYNIGLGEATIPLKVKMFGQMLVGGAIGLSFTRESFFNLKNLIVPSIILVVCLMLFSVLMGIIIHKIAGIDLVTAMFSAAPGGIADMTLIGGEYGGDQSIIVSMHLVRLISVIVFLPQVIDFVNKLLTK